MAINFYDGMQDAIAAPKPEWNTDTVWSGVVTGRDGTATSGVNGPTSFKTVTLPAAATTCIHGIAFYPNGSGAIGANANTYHLGSWNTALTTVQLVLVINTSGFMELRRTSGTGTLLATSSGHAPISIGSWYQIQAKVVLSSTTSGSAEVRLNGSTTPVLTYTGITSSLTAAVSHMRFGVNSANQMYYDDFYFADGVDATATQGRANNDFLGDVKIATLLPTAAGDSTGWTPSTGANYAAVDDNPVNTSDYVSTSVSATRDLYTLSDLPGTVATVFAVRVGMYAQKSDAGASAVKPAIKEGGTVTTQAAQALGTSFGSIFGPAIYLKPSSGTVFTQADVNGLQAGIELA